MAAWGGFGEVGGEIRRQKQKDKFFNPKKYENLLIDISTLATARLLTIGRDSAIFTQWANYGRPARLYQH